MTTMLQARHEPRIEAIDLVPRLAISRSKRTVEATFAATELKAYQLRVRQRAAARRGYSWPEH